MRTATEQPVALEDHERTRCEVWSRVMGYHRPVSAYNAGKQQEHRERVCFDNRKADAAMSKSSGLSCRFCDDAEAWRHHLATATESESYESIAEMIALCSRIEAQGRSAPGPSMRIEEGIALHEERFGDWVPY